ncbi:MAG: site-2 protease family protein [Bacilli bacterium]|nr:site-2 protease family protein [Bacilli bacterium]
MQIVISILIMIVILGVLISLHEAGHLGMAKLFKIYCFEYSIGFGPQLLKVKRKNGETYFSIRAIPLGGYVSMYGEEGAVPDGEEEPPKERSLETKPLWQKLLVFVAGVTVNYLLGLILIFIAVSAFKTYYSGWGYATKTSDRYLTSAYAPYHLSEESSLYAAIRAKLEEAGSSASPNDYMLYAGTSYTIEEDGAQYDYAVLDGLVSLNHLREDGTMEVVGDFAAIYGPGTLTKTHDIAGDIVLFPLLRGEDGTVIATDDAYTEVGIPYKIDFAANRQFTLKDVTGEGTYSFDVKLIFLPKMPDEETGRPIAKENLDASWDGRIEVTQTIQNKANAWASFGLTVDILGIRNSWSEAWDEWVYYVPWANVAIVKGLASLFTSGIKNLSGIVGMTAQVGTVMARGGASMIFLYAGLISINLAFFNLLPFPGLDGWQIVVVVVEKIIRRKINPKVKGIVSYIGLGLLILLALVVTVKDIIGLF